jgi:Lon protease-like protein
MTDPADDLDLSAVPFFPLPGVVLFPVAVLPLHIFEDRYRAMTADALAGNQLIAMALLRPGWEKTYYGRPEIEPVVCAGRILSHEKLPDGKYNLLLQGQVRAKVAREWRSRDAEPSYRVAALERLAETAALEIDLESERRQLTDLFEQSPLRHRGVGRQFRQIARGVMPTPVVADLAAFTFLDDVALKQSLLAETDVRRRVGRTIAALHKTAADATWFAEHISQVSAPQDPRMN